MIARRHDLGSQKRYAAIGILLGLGAPLGSLLLRTLLSTAAAPWDALAHEWGTAAYYYWYMTVGSTTAFGLFGYALGSLNQDLQNLSVTDGLTNIYNHRYLQEHLTQEVRRADRYQTQLTCLMIDIDDFKAINDQHGHIFGDKVLNTIARLIRETVRNTDIAGRYGGEEFLVVMPETNVEAALPLAERILTVISSSPFGVNGEALQVSVSIGLATYPAPQHGVKSKNGVLSAADQALYAAKRAGKNRVVVWKP